MKEVRKIEKAIRESAASMWLDNLPLSKEYVANYRKEKIKGLKSVKVLKLNRGGMGGIRKR